MCAGITAIKSYVPTFNLQDAVQDMRTRLSAKIDHVNNEFHCPLTPRNNKGEMIDCHEYSAQQLFHVVSQLKEIMEERGREGLEIGDK